jgi:hypothetical protein
MVRPPVPVRRSLETLAGPLTVALFAYAAITAVHAALLVRQALGADELALERTFETLGSPIRVIAVLVRTLALVIIGLWLAWQLRAHDNLVAAGVAGLRFTPAWGALWWFVPIANLVQPYREVRDLVVASAAGPGAAVQACRRPAVVPVWWGVWLSSGAIGSVGLLMAFVANETRNESFRTTSVADAVALLRSGDLVAAIGEVGIVIASFAAVSIVRRVGKDQASWPAAPPVPVRPDVPAGTAG